MFRGQSRQGAVDAPVNLGGRVALCAAHEMCAKGDLRRRSVPRLGSPEPPGFQALENGRKRAPLLWDNPLSLTDGGCQTQPFVRYQAQMSATSSSKDRAGLNPRSRAALEASKWRFLVKKSTRRR